MENVYELVSRLEERIARLPAGYIHRRNMWGKTWHYLQWRKKGRVRSKYIRASQVERVQEQLRERKKLRRQLAELRRKLPGDAGAAIPFETNVVTGEALARLAANTCGWEKREAFRLLENYVYGSEWNRVCILYGLRRTGKTTLLLQVAADMREEDLHQAAYIKLQPGNTVEQLNHDLDRLYGQHYKYVFLDDVTLMKDFIDSAALFSDIYVPLGMRIVLSGTDSLGFWFARDNELYARERMIHTTFIPYRESSRIMGAGDVDGYIRYGGVLQDGGITWEAGEAKGRDGIFWDEESTDRYINTAIVKNIQRSLKYYERGNHFYRLYPLHEKGELASAIHKVLEDMNDRFAGEVLAGNFISGGLDIPARDSNGEGGPGDVSLPLGEADRENVARKLIEILEKRSKEKQAAGLDEGLARLIKRYLKSLDLIVDCPIEFARPGLPPQEHILFTQPGMRYCQVQTLVYGLLEDRAAPLLRDEDKAYLAGRIRKKVQEQMFKDMILLEVLKALPKRFKVFKLVFEKGEFDLVIRDRERNTCAAYQISHSAQCVWEQARYLLDAEKQSLTDWRFGKLVGRYVLYLGENLDTEDGIAFRNAEEFLKSLPGITLESRLEGDSFKNDAGEIYDERRMLNMQSAP